MKNIFIYCRLINSLDEVHETKNYIYTVHVHLWFFRNKVGCTRASDKFHKLFGVMSGLKF